KTCSADDGSKKYQSLEATMQQGKTVRPPKVGQARLQAEPSQRPLLVYLQAILPSLNPTERLIGEYVLQDPERVLSSSISEMRRGSGASVGPIVGFGCSPGVDGSAAARAQLTRAVDARGI